MKRRNRAAWAGFAVTALALLGVVTWLTIVLVRLDADELHARRMASVHERLRLALWRMDSWMAPLLAREGMRPASDYRAFPAAPAAWTRSYSRLAPDEVLVKSPLLGVESEVFVLHFDVGPDAITSPQVPRANERDLAEANGIQGAMLDRAAARLERLTPLLSRTLLATLQQDNEARLPLMGCNPTSPTQPLPQKQSIEELSNRQRVMQQGNIVTQQHANAAPFVDNAPTPTQLAGTTDAIGPLLPSWIDDELGLRAELVVMRRVATERGEHFQGALIDWPALQRQLIGLVADLYGPGTELVRCEHPTAVEQPSMLASLPVRLVARCGDEVRSALPLPAMLATTWGATLLGLIVLGITLRAAIGFGERRARFASAVTHELRTPLTTFRMYSEMLADGVVTEPNAQREYLTTLQRESDRLARVVENVLAWSRLEEGRFRSRRGAVEVAGLIERVTPSLQRRLAEAELELVVQVSDAAATAVVTTDEDAIAQILFNLIDNAAKYARGRTPARVELSVDVRGGRVVFDVRDHGPGVPGPLGERIFAPFDRGAVAAGDNEVPGVGLGLALARGLAVDLGGSLRLVADGSPGARFRLELPLEAAAR